MQDSFPEQREVGRHKKAINQLLARLIDSVPNPSGVLLDGLDAWMCVCV